MRNLSFRKKNITVNVPTEDKNTTHWFTKQHFLSINICPKEHTRVLVVYEGVFPTISSKAVKLFCHLHLHGFISMNFQHW